MTIQEFFQEYWTTGLVGLIVASGVIQISPIKWNPWTWIARKIGKAVNGEVIEKVTAVETKLDNHIRADEKETAITKRSRILRFADEVRRGDHHTKENFESILADIDDYEKYAAAHSEFRNSITAHATQLILDIYDDCLRENSFL